MQTADQKPETYIPVVLRCCYNNFMKLKKISLEIGLTI